MNKTLITIRLLTDVNREITIMCVVAMEFGYKTLYYDTLTQQRSLRYRVKVCGKRHLELFMCFVLHKRSE